MKNNNRNNLIITLLSALLFVSTLIFVGCSNSSANVLNTLTINMSKTINTLDNVQDMETSELIIGDFMNENELTTISSSQVENLYSTQAMDAYVAKITALNNCVITTIKTNNELNSLKNAITQKASQVKFLCNQAIESKCSISSNNEQCLKEMNNTLMSNVTRVGLTRNEISNNYKKVAEIKDYYGSMPDRLNSRYSKLNSSLNTRLSYYTNIATSLDDIEELIRSIDTCLNDIETIEQQTQKTGITKNIDTYENAGTNIFGDYRNNPAYNPENYLRNYYPGYGMNGFNGYGMNGFGGYGMNGYGINGYGFGNPFNGYMYPNINTFGTYKNIDSYKSHKEINKEEKETMPNNTGESKGLDKKEKSSPLPHELDVIKKPITKDTNEQSEQFVAMEN